jgi:hypothetical protein
MGRHSAEHFEKKEQPRESLLEITLTRLRELFHIEAREDSDRNTGPREWGVGDDAETEQWLKEVTADRLPALNLESATHENWEYRIYKNYNHIVGGWYGMTPTGEGKEDEVAYAILSEWLDWNGILEEDRGHYALEARRLGSDKWSGSAVGLA